MGLPTQNKKERGKKQNYKMHPVDVCSGKIERLMRRGSMRNRKALVLIFVFFAILFVHSVCEGESGRLG